MNEEVTRVDGPGGPSVDDSEAPWTSPIDPAKLPPNRSPSASMIDASAPLPTRIGRFVIVRKLGEGGMGVVFDAFDPELERRVAIKVLRPAMRNDRNSQGQARLQREAQTMARLSHPNVVQIYEVDQVEGLVYLAMEYVPGKDLRAWLAAKPRSWREVLGVFMQAGQGLVAAHAAGIIHRDFKPDNVLVGDDGRVRVLDFGLARPQRDGEVDEFLPPGAGVGSSHKVTLTQIGAYIGTPAYMSPEQHLCKPADAQSDQFGFCISLHECLYGRRPFAGKTAAELRLAVFRPPEPPPSERRVPARLRRIVLRGLSVEPADRYPDMQALLAELGRDPARTWKRVGVGVGALGLAILGGLGSGWLADERRCSHGDEPLVGVWDRDRAGQARAAFLATGVPYAAETWPKVQAALDAHATAWAARREDACAATHVRGEASEELLDLRNECLDGRLRELDGLVEAFITADAATVERALQATTGLAPLAVCDDARYLRARVKPPADPALAEQVARARVLLARAAARRDAGRPREAREIATVVRRASQDLDYPPLHAETLLELGRGEEATADYLLAQEHLRAAYHLALGIADDPVAADAAIALSLVHYRKAEFAASFEWSEHARSLLRRTGEPPEQMVLYLLYRSYAQSRLGLHLDAVASAEQALKLAEADFPPLDPRRGRMLAGLAHARWAADDEDGALDLFKRSQLSWSDGLGADHPFVASSAINISTIYINRRAFEDAAAVLRPALGIMERAFGPDHPNVADTLVNLASLATIQGRLREAAEADARALRIYLRVDPDRPLVITLLTDLGDLHNLLGRHDEALATLRQALALRQRLPEPDLEDQAQLRILIGDVLTDMRRPQAAAEEYRAALELLARKPDPGLQQGALGGLARLARERGAPVEAEALARQALALDVGEEHERAPILTEHGAALLALGRVDEAVAACEQALALDERSFGVDNFRSTPALLCLGRAYHARKDDGAAADALERAVAIHERSDTAPELRAAAREALAAVLRAREPSAAAALAARAAEDYARAGPAFARDAARARAG
jgi:tetratricopeptide (TPR) repeat protein